MFDEFYCCIYDELFLHWILSNEKEYRKHHFHCYISKVDKFRTIVSFDSLKCNARITIWRDGNEIVEQEIFDKADNSLLFYLHFRLTEIAQFRNLFYEFYNALIKLNDSKSYTIAFVCSGGLSTSLFVEELLEVCKLQKLDYQLTSISLDKLEERNYDFDAIYLAPQISHLQPELIRKTEHKVPIHKVDPTVFATKDYQGVIKAIKANIEKDYH